MEQELIEGLKLRGRISELYFELTGNILIPYIYKKEDNNMNILRSKIEVFGKKLYYSEILCIVLSIENDGLSIILPRRYGIWQISNAYGIYCAFCSAINRKYKQLDELYMNYEKEDK